MECRFCGREIKNVGSLAAHEKSCKLNPQRVKRTRAPGAGAKKGSIPWNAGKRVGRNVVWDDRYPLEDVLVEHSTYPRYCLRRRLITTGILQYSCACCGIEAIWNGKPMPLILDHINGINDDNRLENLRFVCSNCDSQLDTYKARNKRKRKPIGDGT